MTFAERAANYNKTFPKWPPLQATDRWLYGVWDQGNNYEGSGFFGAYPPGYIERVMAIFPEIWPLDNRVLHLFSGSLGHKISGIKLDLLARPGIDLRANAHHLPFAANSIRFVMSDPPYDKRAAKIYGTSMVVRATVMRELYRVTMPGAHVVHLDTVKPMFRNDQWTLWGEIGYFGSTNHVVRGVFLFERK